MVGDREVWQRLAEKARSAFESNDPPGPRFTTWVAILAAISAVVMLIGLVVMATHSKTDDLWMVGLLVLVFGAISFAVSGQHLINEASRPTLPASDPASLAEVFLSSLALERWDTAKACLSRVARVRTEREEIPALGLKGQTFNLALDQYFKAYWAPLCGSEGLTQVYMEHEVRRVEPIEPGLSVVWVSVRIARRQELAVATATTAFKVFGRLVAYKRNDAWHLLHGGLPLGADVRLPLLDEPAEGRGRDSGRAARPSTGSEPPAPAPPRGNRIGGGQAPSGKKVSGRLLGGRPSAPGGESAPS